jgi:tetratricopeptide (TPR) repeat protein
MLPLAAVLVAAALVRLLYLHELPRNPFFGRPIIDAAEYYGWAKTIAGGEWLWTRVHIHGPAYPYLLAILMRLGGSFGTFAAVQHLIGIATLYLLYDTGKRVAGRTAGLVAAAAGLLYARFLFLEGLLLAETLVAFLDLLLVRLAVGLGKRDARPRAWALPGLVAGLSAIARPTVLVAVPALAFHAYRSGAKERAALRAGAVLLGVALFVVFVALRNAAIGDPVLVQANSGMNFYIGNRAGADGLASVPPGTEWNAIERLADDAGAFRQADRDRFYFRRAFEEMATEPGGAALRAVKRLLLFWGGREVDIEQDFGFFRERSGALKILVLPALLIAPLALYGVVLSLRRGAWSNFPLLFLLSYLVAVLPFPYASRYRMPVFPLLVLFASLAALHIARRARAARPWKEIGAVATLVLVLNLVPPGVPAESVVRVHLHLGKILYDRGDARGALAEYLKALDRDPESADVWNNIGLAREELGDRDGALQAYRRALRGAPDHGKACANVAGIFYQTGNLDSAYAAMREAVRCEPRNPEFLNNLGALELQRGAVQEAIAALERGASLAPSNRDVLFNLGRAYERAGRVEDAGLVFRRLLSLRETKEVRVRLGAVEGAAGRRDRAAEEYARALAIQPDYPDALRALGLLLLGEERRAEAIPLLQKYLRVRPEDGDVRTLVEGDSAAAR